MKSSNIERKYHHDERKKVLKMYWIPKNISESRKIYFVLRMINVQSYTLDLQWIERMRFNKTKRSHFVWRLGIHIEFMKSFQYTHTQKSHNAMTFHRFFQIKNLHIFFFHQQTFAITCQYGGCENFNISYHFCWQSRTLPRQRSEQENIVNFIHVSKMSKFIFAISKSRTKSE